MIASEAQKRANKKWYAKAKDMVLERMRRYSKTPRGKAVQAKKDKTSQVKHSQHWYARNAVWRAVKSGKLLVALWCEYEGNEYCKYQGKLQAHHYKGYSKKNWLEVKWLCPEHHREADKEVIGNIYANPELLV
jgi:hypothetical protein